MIGLSLSDPEAARLDASGLAWRPVDYGYDVTDAEGRWRFRLRRFNGHFVLYASTCTPPDEPFVTGVLADVVAAAEFEAELGIDADADFEDAEEGLPDPGSAPPPEVLVRARAAHRSAVRYAIGCSLKNDDLIALSEATLLRGAAALYTAAQDAVAGPSVATAQVVNRLVLTCGLPRSGKSTWSRSCGYPVVCPDQIRLAALGQAFFGAAEPLVWFVVDVMIKSLFGSGHPTVVLDATNTTRQRRDKWRSSQWRTYVKTFPVPKEECLRRARVTDPTLAAVINRMAADYDPPGLDEELWP
jgi:predicted kinase